MIEEIKTEKIVSPFKGAEWIEDMNSGDIINKMKDMSYLFRTKGGRSTRIEIINVQRQSYDGSCDYTLKRPICKEVVGTDMSNHRPTIDGIEYTWGELKKFPKQLLQIKLYRYWLQKESEKDE